VREVLDDIRRWRERGDKVALATVVSTRRSAPRPVGSKLAISERGELAGSVSGGCVESDVAETAREVIASGRPALRSYGYTDERAWEVGLPCGGEIDVFVERLDGELPDPDEPAVQFTVVEGDRIGTRWLEAPNGTRSGLVELEGERVFAEVLGPPPALLVLGAGDIAEALCSIMNVVGWRTVVADPRARFATRERVPSAGELVVEQPDQAVRRIDPNTAVVTLSHEERFDVPMLAGAIEAGAFYVGALGSRRTGERRRNLLAEAGVPPEQIDRISTPVGLEIGAETPAEIAVSIAAELVAKRR
jgi:xanthine dehydrogenase accessory factor